MDALSPDQRPAVFFDRDGTLIEEKDYLHRPEDVVLFPGVVAALSQAQQSGYLLFMITNQSGVGRGYFSMADVENVHRHIETILGQSGVIITKIYVAPEAPDQPSRGRKPSPAFLFDARDEFNLDLPRSCMIGDKWIDLETGWNADLRKSVLVRTGYGKKVEAEHAGKVDPAVAVDTFPAAIDLILSLS